tara:strand:+ start:3402 stop:3566 length:165 start_codon:yes stop_codon:yes gene_type:complete
VREVLDVIAPWLLLAIKEDTIILLQEWDFEGRGGKGIGDRLGQESGRVPQYQHQ